MTGSFPLSIRRFFIFGDPFPPELSCWKFIYNPD